MTKQADDYNLHLIKKSIIIWILMQLFCCFFWLPINLLFFFTSSKWFGIVISLNASSDAGLLTLLNIEFLDLKFLNIKFWFQFIVDLSLLVSCHCSLIWYCHQHHHLLGIGIGVGISIGICSFLWSFKFILQPSTILLAITIENS